MFIPYTIRNASTSTQRRRRTKVRALVTPFPVGVVMVMVVQPSPPSPSPAMHGPFLTKMSVSMAFAIWFMLVDACASASPPYGGSRLPVAPPGRWPPRRSPPAPPAAPASSVQSPQTDCWRGFHEQQTGLRRHSRQANRRGDFARIAADPVARLTVPLPRSSIFFSSSGWSCLGLRRRGVSPPAGLPSGASVRRRRYSTTISTFSSAQMMLLVKRGAFDDRLRGARQIGGLYPPPPAGCRPRRQLRRLLACLRAASTTASPPVTTSRPIPGYLNSRWAVSISGLRHGHQQVGRAAGGHYRLVKQGDRPLRDLFRRRMGAKTTLLPAAIGLMALLITVAAGLVEGVTEATTPQGAFFNQRQAVIAGQHLRSQDTPRPAYPVPAPRFWQTYLQRVPCRSPSPQAPPVHGHAFSPASREWPESPADASPPL